MSPQTKQAERDKLHRTLDEIANDLRGKVDGWDFKAYVLGTLFYRYLCEHLVHVINSEQLAAGEEGFEYAKLDDKIAEDAREHYTEMLGYYILPSQLFDALVADSKENEDLNIDLRDAFRAVEESTVSADSADDFAGLFQDFDVSSNRLGGTVKERSERLGSIMRAVSRSWSWVALATPPSTCLATHMSISSVCTPRMQAAVVASTSHRRKSPKFWPKSR